MIQEGVNIRSCDKNLKLNSIICGISFSHSQVKDWLADMIVEIKLNMLTKSDLYYADEFHWNLEERWNFYEVIR